MADHPGVIFKAGPTGRRAALAYGPDVLEIIKFLHDVEERGPTALTAAAEVFAVDVNVITAAARYYSDYSSDVDAEINAAEDASCPRAETRGEPRVAR